MGFEDPYKPLIARLPVLPLLLLGACGQGAATEPGANFNEWYVACGCGCCGGPGVFEPGDPGECVTREDLAKLRTADVKIPSEPRCANVGCSKGTLFRVCDPKVGPLVLVSDFAPPQVVIDLPSRLSGRWQADDVVTLDGADYVVKQTNSSPIGGGVDQVTLDHPPPRRVPAGTPLVHTRPPR